MFMIMIMNMIIIMIMNNFEWNVYEHDSGNDHEILLVGGIEKRFTDEGKRLLFYPSLVTLECR